MIGTEQPFPGRENLLDQRDRVGGPARRMVRGGEPFSRVHGVRMIRTQGPLEAGDQPLTEHDGLRHAVAGLD